MTGQHRADPGGWLRRIKPLRPTGASLGRLVAYLTEHLGAAEIASATTKEIRMTHPRSANREDTTR